MAEAPSEKVACAGCGRSFSAAMGVCPFCGHLKDSAVAATAVPANPPPPPPDAPPAPSRRAAPACNGYAVGIAGRPACAKCGASSGLTKVRIETWADKGLTLTGKQKYRVRWVDAPCYCKPCSVGLLKRRLAADALTVLPIALLIPVAVAGNRGAFVPIAAVFFYSIYLIRWGGYTWADKMLYGYELESMLSGWIPAPESGEGPGKVKFPGGCLHALLRLVFAVVLSILVAIIASTLGVGR